MKALEWSQHSSIKSLWGIFQTLRGTYNSLVHSLAKFEPIRDFMVGLVTCKNRKELIKNEEARVVTSFFPHYNPIGAIC